MVVVVGGGVDVAGLEGEVVVVGAGLGGGGTVLGAVAGAPVLGAAPGR